jgi:hypothetical protein
MRRFEITQDMYNSITGSASTQVLPLDQWPNFVTKIPGVQYVAVWRSTRSGIDAAMQVIRESDSTQYEWKVDQWYTLANVSDGRYYMWGPDKDIYQQGPDGLELKHHTKWLNPWNIPSDESR